MALDCILNGCWKICVPFYIESCALKTVTPLIKKIPCHALCGFWFLPCTMRVGLPSGCHPASLITSHENWTIPGMEVRAGTMGRGMRSLSCGPGLPAVKADRSLWPDRFTRSLSCSTRGEGLLRASTTTLSDVQSKVA